MTNGTTESHAEPEMLVGGRYRLVSRLGAGGFGRVWRAHDTQLAVDVALKEVVLPAAMAANEQTERLERAEREARNAARLRGHPNIVTVYDVVIQDGVPWTVMQLIEGRSLEDWLAAHGPLPVDAVAKIAETMLGALGAAHAAGIVHRDVKPANVMLSDNGGVLLTDFGIAVQQEDSGLTATGTFIGSVEYIAPERVRGEAARPASDLFSLGVTLYQAVEGISPFRKDSTVASLSAVLFEEQPPPRRAGRLTGLLNGLLAKDPATRFTVEQSMAALGGAVQPAYAAPARDRAAAAPAYRAGTPTAPGFNPASVATQQSWAPPASSAANTRAAFGSYSDPTRFLFPGALIAALILSLFLPSVNGRSGWTLLDAFEPDTVGVIIRDVIQGLSIANALVILAVLAPRTDQAVRVLGYLAVAVGVGVEVFSMVANRGGIIPWRSDFRLRWEDGIWPGAGTWLYWLFLVALPVLYAIRDARTRRVRRAVLSR